MSAHAEPAAELTAELTANDRWKQGWEQVFWRSMIIAIVAHFAVFQFWPSMVAADIRPDDQTVTQMIPPPDAELPPPPDQIQTPATPVISETPISDEITVPDLRFDVVPPPVLVRPPEVVDSARGSGFTAYEVAPILTNRARIEDALRREYPSTLRDAGIGGIVQVVFSIDAQGQILSTEVGASSGHPRLDEAALRVAGMMQFSPAMNRDVAVPVRVTFPIHFTVRTPLSTRPGKAG